MIVEVLTILPETKVSFYVSLKDEMKAFNVVRALKLASTTLKLIDAITGSIN